MFRTSMLVCALVGVIAFAGSASGGGSGWPQPDARDKALLSSVLRGMRTDLRTVRLAQLPAQMRGGRRQGTLALLTTTAVNRKNHVRSIRADWDALLIAHAYNEQCVRGADHCVAVSMGPSGGGGAGASGARRPYWGARALGQALRHRFAAAGLRVTSISFEHPNALAPIITVRSSHPRRAWNAYVRKARLAIFRRHADGIFIEMFDGHGRLFFISAGSGSAGEGWCAPLLRCPGL